MQQKQQLTGVFASDPPQEAVTRRPKS